jgi:hypothetical protein
VSGHSPYETIALISGPEPHRSILENKLIKHLQKSLFPSLIVRGVPSQQTEEVNILNVKLLSHLDTPTLQSLIASTPTVMCRSGYSTLMDLAPKVESQKINLGSVDERSGSFLYSYSFPLPEFRGMNPELSLNYNSYFKEKKKSSTCSIKRFRSASDLIVSKGKPKAQVL